MMVRGLFGAVQDVISANRIGGMALKDLGEALYMRDKSGTG